MQTEKDVQTTAETVDKDRVKLRVEVPEVAFKPALDAVYRRWSQELKVSGFRKGKVPRQIIDARVGIEEIRREALEDSLGDFYRAGIKAEEIEPIAPPDIEVVTFEVGSPLVFEATVDIRPEIELPDLASISFEAPPSEVTDEDIDGQLDRLRDRFSELETVPRPVKRGDYALIDLNGYRHEEPVEGASQPDLLYEVGSRSGPPKLDDELDGARPGEILKFTSEMPGDTEDISFTVLVKEVKGKRLPELDDEFAKTVGEFDTLDDLKEDLRTRLGEVKQRFVEEQIRAGVLEAFVDASDLEPPEKLVESEFEHRLSHFEEDLEKAGATMADYERHTETTELEVRRDIRAQGARSVKAELLLEEVARREEIDVSQEDLGREVAVLAAQSGRDAGEVAQQLVEGNRLGALATDIMRRKALDVVVERANVIGRRTDES